MTVDQFARFAVLEDATEIEKVASLAYYFYANKDQPEFTVKEMADIISALGYAAPNAHRLKDKVKAAKTFIKGSKADYFRLSVVARKSLEERWPDLSATEEIISDSAILPEILITEVRRPYLDRIAKQINAAYENNMFDCCALMMRRMLEVLLIHSFQHAGIVDQITDTDGSIQPLKTLINKAKSLTEIKMSGGISKSIDQFRELGNLSAHLIHYSCRRDDIRHMRMEFRAVIEELLYLAGLKK